MIEEAHLKLVFVLYYHQDQSIMQYAFQKPLTFKAIIELEVQHGCFTAFNMTVKLSSSLQERELNDTPCH